jgi:hypothetical protein
MYLSFQKVSQSLRRVSSVVTDAYFNLVTLLLNTTTTNGAQNNTFLDSSTNNFTITRNGNATQGTFTPFSQTGWSNRLSSGNDLSGASNAGYQFDSGNFTVEGWFYFNTVGNAQFLSVAVVGALYWQYYAGALDFGNNAGGSVQASWSPVANTWYHIAAVRNGSTFTNYINGAVHSSGTAFNVTATGLLKIGYGGAGSFDGYISNIRIVKGTAVYTAAFTPPTVPLTAITNTQLLTCQANRFLDSSTNGIAISVNSGSPSVQAFSPFAPTTAYSTDVVGGSGYFDGTGDWLVTPSSGQFAPTGDWTISFWYYPTNLTNYMSLVASDSGGNVSSQWKIEVDANGLCKLWLSGFSAVTFTGSNGNFIKNQWHFVNITRSGSTGTFKINGATIGTFSYTQTLGTSSLPITIGASTGGANPSTGYYSDVRLVAGSAVTTLPTAPLTAITGTNLLLNYTNAGIYDSAAKNDLETVGNAQVSTTQAKWGTTSMYFDGAGDYLVSNTATTDLYAFGSGAFTIELWIYLNTVSGAQILYDGRPSGTQTTQPTIYMNGAVVTYYANGSNQINGSSLSTGQWYHIAVARSGTSTKMFVNGTQAGSTYTDSTVYTNTASRPIIGVDSFSLGTNPLNGYIDDLRVTKGYARYTANFTAPTSAFPTQ